MNKQRLKDRQREMFVRNQSPPTNLSKKSKHGNLAFEYINPAIHEMLLKTLERNRMSIRKAARICGIHYSSLYRIVTTTKNVNLQNLRKIADWLGLPASTPLTKTSEPYGGLGFCVWIEKQLSDDPILCTDAASNVAALMRAAYKNFVGGC